MRNLFHGAHTLIDQSLLKMMSSPSVKKKSKNYYSDDIGKDITEIQTEDISQAKSVHEYSIPLQILAWKFKNKRENVA